LNSFSIGLFFPLVGLAPIRTVGVFLLAFYIALELQKAGSWPIVAEMACTKYCWTVKNTYGALENMFLYESKQFESCFYKL
jgi:hypothetical protein